MTTTTADLLDLVVAALKGTTGARENVFAPRDWATWNGSYPAIMAQSLHERKESLGRATIEFTVTSTIRLVARVDAPAQLDDAGAGDVQTKLWILAREIEVAVINSAVLTKKLQHFPFVDSQMKATAEGKEHIGEMMIDIGLEFYQGPEDFAPTETVALKNIQINTDLTNVDDPSGDYDPNFEYPTQKAPRTEGPDGRVEGGLDIDL